MSELKRDVAKMLSGEKMRKGIGNERWDKCRTCGARVTFGTKNGRHIALDKDGRQHGCEDA